MSRPSRKLACGALGRYDRDQVLAIASGLEGESTIVHEDRGRCSSWIANRSGGRGRAGGASRGANGPETISGAGIRDWRDAACAAAACGLVLDGRRSYVHSSVAGMAPVYYMEHDGAVYFATTIDALALASPRRLSVDWEAWAGILTVDFPLGDRTPFAEIRLLRPFSTLEVRWRRARVETSRWPWAEVESNLDVAEGTAAVLDGMRASIARLPAWADRLSSQRWPRLPALPRTPFRAAPQRHLRRSPWTPTRGTDRERQIAAQLAAASGFPHHAVVGSRGLLAGSRGAVATRRLSGPPPALADAGARGSCATPARPRSTGSASTTWPGPTLGSSPPKPSAPKATTRQSRASGTQCARDRPAGHLGCSLTGSVPPFGRPRTGNTWPSRSASADTPPGRS